MTMNENSRRFELKLKVIQIWSKFESKAQIDSDEIPLVIIATATTVITSHRTLLEQQPPLITKWTD